MASIGDGWVDGAWVQAAWVTTGGPAWVGGDSAPAVGTGDLETGNLILRSDANDIAVLTPTAKNAGLIRQSSIVKRY
jgi:hypothetical protein